MAAAGLLALALLSSPQPAAAQTGAASPPLRLEVEGKEVAVDPPPFIDAGRTLVPIRFAAEALGAQVGWHPEQQQVVVGFPGRQVVLTIGRNQARVGDAEVTLDVPPRIVAGRTFVPVRFVAEGLGATVEWDADTYTVRLWRQPSQVRRVTLNRAVGAAEIRVELSAPLLSHRLETRPDDPTGLVLSLYPAVPATALPEVPESDPLLAGLRFEPDGRGLRLVVDRRRGGPYRLEPDPDGLGLTLKLFYQVTGVEVSQDGWVPVVTIRTDGPVAYQTLTLAQPHRLVIDLPGVTPAPGLPAEVPGVPTLGLQRVRTGEPLPQVTRVVLDLAGPRPPVITPTADGLVVRLPPHLTDLRWEALQGRTRLTLLLTGPAAATAELLPDGRHLRVRIPQAVAAVPQVPQPGPGMAATRITLSQSGSPPGLDVVLEVPYYQGHRLLSGPGEGQVVLELEGSPVYGRRIWVDPGHGGHDPGALGPSGSQEKQVNLAVALRLRELLTQAGAQVQVTRQDDRFVELRARIQGANAAQADIFVSIHANSAGSPQAAGIETYYWDNHPESARLAQAIHRHLIEELGLRDRGVKKNDYLVLREARMPAVLVELGFISNPEEERLLTDPSFQQRAAIAIQKGIFDYFQQE
ncbi:MAG: N-acetylmuramoyl-L-alanine amidase family protein [Bacillota bacterium]